MQKNRFNIEKLEQRIAPAIAKTTFYVKVPGPNDAQITTATNPAGNQAVGQQSTTFVKNRFAK